MKNILAIIVLAFTISLNAQSYIEHKVKVGETIESIAKDYLVTTSDIYALNPDAKRKIQPNSVLIIPNSKVKNEAQKAEKRELIGYKKHKVKRKETLFSLSQEYNVSIEEIKKANRELYSKNLRKGDRIRIPKFRTVVYKETLNNTLKKYIVQPSEGKWRIAYKFGITVAELEGLNPGMNEVIQPGDELNVPNILDEEEKPIETQYGYYEVLPKEGFFRLKIKTGLTQEQLEALNPELKESGLKAGMVLKVPAAIEAKSKSDTLEVTDLGNRLVNLQKKKIALLMPYQLHRIDVDSVEEAKAMIKNSKSLSSVLDFHIGVTMALDSAKQLGISTDLKVLDTRYRISEISRILKENDFSDYDAIIGPIEEDGLDRVANALKQDSVPVIAPMSMPKELYPNIFQTLPEDKLLRDAMINFVKADSLNPTIVVISDHANKKTSDALKKEFPTAKQLFSNKNKDGEDEYFIYPVNLTNAISNGKTIVFLETNNNSFASSVISMLNGLLSNDMEIILMTLDKNKAFEGKNIDNYHLSNLQFHYPSVNRNFEEGKTNGFVEAYRNEYGVSPSKYAVRGFDITLDVLLRLAADENIFRASNQVFETEYIENKFRYKKSFFGGYKNEAIYIVKYNDLKIVEAKQPE